MFFKKRDKGLVVWKRVLLVILPWGFLMGGTEADAQTTVKRKKRVKIDFEDELLEGNVSNPNIFHLFHKKQISYDRLIKMRKDFLPEMRRTGGELE